MPRATDKGIEFGSDLQRVAVPLANTLIISVPARAQADSRPGSRLRTTWARQRRTSVLPPGAGDGTSVSRTLARGALAGPARTGARADPLLAASRRQDYFPAVCAQTCGWLVRNGAKPVHRRWKCWGFRRLAGTRRGHLPGRARAMPVHTEKIS